MSEHVKAWECIGCGRIEAPQTCVGICEDRKVEFVYAFEHESVLAELQAARRGENVLAALARRLAWTTPRAGEWERSYRALQQEARAILAANNPVR
jgi:hypothetical protein